MYCKYKKSCYPKCLDIYKYIPIKKFLAIFYSNNKKTYLKKYNQNSNFFLSYLMRYVTIKINWLKFFYSSFLLLILSKYMQVTINALIYF